jgi:hypothetical protein
LDPGTRLRMKWKGQERRMLSKVETSKTCDNVSRVPDSFTPRTDVGFGVQMFHSDPGFMHFGDFSLMKNFPYLSLIFSYFYPL